MSATGTAVTPFSEAGCTPQDIRAITRHGIDSIERIIERYCARTDQFASNAIIMLERTRGWTDPAKRTAKR
jgi:hypothetical protein